MESIFYRNNPNLEISRKMEELKKREKHLKIREEFLIRQYETIEEIKKADYNEIDGCSVTRNSPIYRRWVSDVKERDKVCQCCGFPKDKHLVAHHIYGYENYPSLRVELSNGILLCKYCHNRYHSLYGVANANAYDFAEYMKRFSVR